VQDKIIHHPAGARVSEKDDSAADESECGPACDSLGDPFYAEKKSEFVEGQGEAGKAFGVYAWPHVVLIEPADGVVVWEGYPFLRGYELTADKVQKYIDVCFKDKKLQ